MDTNAATTGQPASAANGHRRDLSAELPWAAAFVQRMRQAHGVQHVNDMIKRSLKGERNCFFTMERCRRDASLIKTFGQPFDVLTKPGAVDLQLLAQMMASGGGAGAGWMQPPAGAAVHTSAQPEASHA